MAMHEDTDMHSHLLRTQPYALTLQAGQSNPLYETYIQTAAVGTGPRSPLRNIEQGTKKCGTNQHELLAIPILLSR